MKNIYNILLHHKANDKVTRKQHIENISKIKNDIDNNICPRCGSSLIVRQGKYGKFYGCSNYPKCKFIKKN